MHQLPIFIIIHNYFAHNRCINSKAPLYNAKTLTSLKTLLNSPDVKKEEALQLLRYLKVEADHVKAECVKEMKERWGFAWKLNVGFHAVQSME